MIEQAPSGAAGDNCRGKKERLSAIFNRSNSICFNLIGLMAAGWTNLFAVYLLSKSLGAQLVVLFLKIPSRIEFKSDNEISSLNASKILSAPTCSIIRFTA